MLSYVIRRILLMIPTLIVISVISYVIIELPPGDFVTMQIRQLEQNGTQVSDDLIQGLRHRYGLDQPVMVRYWRWVSRFVTGDFGYSMAWNAPVKDLILQRLGLSILVSASALLFTWMVSLPIGVYSATRQYSAADHLFTLVGFLGLSIPNFLLALVLMYLSYKWFGSSVGGLFSPEFVREPWSWPKVVDMLHHLWIPLIVVGTAGTAGTIRVLRANLIDELRKPYVISARANGLKEWRLLIKYPLRIALNPFISTVGWLLPILISGEVITAVVLNLPTAGPLFLGALQQQDMYLAGAFVMLFSILTVVGTLVSDIFLALVDPRIRYD